MCYLCLNIYGVSKRFLQCPGDMAQWSQHMPKESLRFYFAAAEWGWRDEALECARELIRCSTDVSTIQTQYIPEMETMLNVAYYRLLRYIECCSKAVSSALVVDGLPRLPCSLGMCGSLSWSLRTVSKSSLESIQMDRPPSFLASCLTSVKAELQQKPCKDTVALQSPSAKLVIAAVMGYVATMGSGSSCACHGNVKENDRVEWAIAFLDRCAAAVEKALATVSTGAF